MSLPISFFRTLIKIYLAIKIILGALIGPRFIGIRNTLPLSAHVDTASLFSFFIFMAIFGKLSCSRSSDFA